MKREEKLTFKKLLAVLQKEWQRSESQRAAAPTCVGSTVRVVVHENGTYYVAQDVIIEDGYEKSAALEHVSIVEVPIAHWWKMIFDGEACGQFSRWERYDAWSVIRALRVAREKEKG